MESLHGAMCEHLHSDQRDYTSQRGAFQFDLDYNFIDGSVIELIHTPQPPTMTYDDRRQQTLAPDPLIDRPMPTAMKRSRSKRSKPRQRYWHLQVSESDLFDDTPHPEAASQLINCTLYDLHLNLVTNHYSSFSKLTRNNVLLKKDIVFIKFKHELHMKPVEFVEFYT